jgi:hypothetical protein
MSINANLVIAYREATTVMDTAASRGYEIADGYTRHGAIAEQAAEAIDAPSQNTPSYPDDADDVASWLEAAATARVMQRETLAVADELVGRARADALAAAKAATPGYVAAVCADFSRFADSFTKLAPDAPRDLDGRTETAAFKQYQKLLGAVDGLNAAAFDRLTFANFGGERESIGGQPVFLVLDPSEDASLQSVLDVRDRYQGRLPGTLEEWDELAAVGRIAIAPMWAVESRRDRVDQAAYAARLRAGLAGLAPGTTLAEGLALVRTPQPAA